MGTIYFVGCRDCNVYRDLDKFYSMENAGTRKECQRIAEQIEKVDSFRAALLVSFLWTHEGHNCTAFNEHNDTEYERFLNKKAHLESGVFWREESKNGD